MDYEKGLSRLRQQLTQTNDEEIIRKFTSLEKQLREIVQSDEPYLGGPESVTDIDNIINQLNKLSYRMLGVPFVRLYKDPRRSVSSRILSFPLTKVLLLILVVLSVPPLTIAVASSVSHSEYQQQVDEARQEIEAIDLKIGDHVTSFFYLSQISPCDDNILETIFVTNLIEVELIKLTIENQASQTASQCIWVYKNAQDDSVIAKDTWMSFALNSKTHLQQRVYYQNGTIIARDFFDTESMDCFRSREYLTTDGHVIMMECYSEAGKLTSLQPVDAFAPIPPMLYWFFYR